MTLIFHIIDWMAFLVLLGKLTINVESIFLLYSYAVIRFMVHELTSHGFDWISNMVTVWPSRWLFITILYRWLHSCKIAIYINLCVWEIIIVVFIEVNQHLRWKLFTLIPVQSLQETRLPRNRIYTYILASDITAQCLLRHSKYLLWI